MVDGGIDPDIPSTSQVDNIEVINVNKNNLTVLWPEILVDLAGCDYLAIDLELSGLGNLSGARNRDVEKRYSALREAACSRSVLSLGIAFFSSKGKNIGSRCLDYSCKAYNILTLCSQSFTIEPDALKFLAKHSFDFNRLISEGVPYSVSSAKGACPLRSLITEIFCSQKTLLLHNGLVDVLFLYHHFYSPLPESWGTLLNALSDLFTAESPLCDSKYLTEFEYRSPATFLEYVFRKSQRDNHREAGEGRYHLGISFPSTSHVSFSEKVICSLPANFPYHAVPANLAELVCSSFANHGYCGQHSKGLCPKSHDVDLSLDLEYLKREKERLKKKRKYDYLKPETILKKEREQIEAKALKIVENLAAPSEPRIAITGCHRAGVDAFMTGFTVLYNERVNLWRTGKLDPMHLNKIPLSGKDRPLQLQPTHSAGDCPLHEERFAQIQSRQINAMHRPRFGRGYREAIFPNQTMPPQFFPPPRVTNGKTYSVLDPESEWNMLRRHLDEIGPSTSTSSLSSERDFIQLDPWSICRRVPVEPKLSEPKKMWIEGDLIENGDPVPEYKKATSKPVIPSRELDIDVISRHEKLKKRVEQELLEMRIYISKQASDGSKKIRDDFVVFCQPETRKSYITMTKDGLDAAVHMKSTTNEFCRILYIQTVSMEDLKKRVAEEYRTFKGIRALSQTEKDFCPYHPEVDYNDSYELYFGDPEDGEKMCREDNAARLFPVSMDGLTGEESSGVQIRLRWNNEPMVGRAIVRLKREFQDKAERVLLSSIVNRISDRMEDEEGQVEMMCSFTINRDLDNRTQEDYQYIFDQIMDINEIPAETELIRGDWLDFTKESIRFKINQRICRCAINSNNWTFATEPYTEGQWRQFLRQYRRELKWTVELGGIDEKGYQTATVKFTDKEYGQRIVEYIQINLNPEFFRFHKRQIEGTAFYTTYVEKIYIPKLFRWMCRERIKELDDQMREDGNILEEWVRLRDLPDDLMAIEGNSLEVVAHYKGKLEEILKGESLNCSSQTNAQLLYGCGLQWVNVQQKKYASEVLISVDRAHEQIYFYGSRQAVDSVKEQLLLFVRDPHNFLVSCEIAIGMPKFLPVMTCVLDSNGEKVLSALLGGCQIGFARPNKLTFKGTVHQYNNLKLMLDTTQYNVMAKYTEGALGALAKEKIVALEECAVCLSPHSYDKYRLACGHSYCLQCLTRMIQIGLKSQELPLRCAARKCGLPIALNIILSLIFDENSFKYKEFFLDRLAPFNKAATTVGAKKGDLPCCIKPGCEGFCPKREAVADPTAIICPLCNTARCSHCPNPPHASRSCQQEADLRANDELSIEHYIKDRRDNVKKCPTKNCQALIQKEQGCNHMQCTFCKMHFCWVCLFSAPTQNLVYGHMQTEHGTTGGEWAHLDFDFGEGGFNRDRQIERFIAELHDMGQRDFFGRRRDFIPIDDSDDEW